METLVGKTDYYKIGMKGKSKNRHYGIGYTLTILATVQHPIDARVLERCAIEYCRGDYRCLNKQDGGGGAQDTYSESSWCIYVAVISKENVNPKDIVPGLTALTSLTSYKKVMSDDLKIERIKKNIIYYQIQTGTTHKKYVCTSEGCYAICDREYTQYRRCADCVNSSSKQKTRNI